MNLSQVSEIRTLLEIDNAAASLRASLEDVEWRIANSPELDRVRSQADEAAVALAEAKKHQRRLDGEVAGLTAKIEPEEKRLYDGSVKNPKELTAIQHELDLLKDHRSKLEDELLEVLATVEEATAANKAGKAALAKVEAGRATEVTELTAEAKELASTIAATDSNRLVQLAKVEPRNLKAYNDARRRHGSSAVARVAGGNCGGCRVGIPESVRKRAFTADLIAQCPNCDRILYVG